MDTTGQVQAARTSVLAIPSGRATLVVTGADRVTWLNGLVTCNLAKTPTGQAIYGLIVARNGRVLADAEIFVDEARLLVGVPASTVELLQVHLEHYHIMEDVEVDAGPGHFETWSLQGPKAALLLGAAREAGGVGAELDRARLGGAVVFAARADAERVRDALLRATADAGGLTGDTNGWRALRLEQGVPEFGEDFDDKTYPQEAGLESVAVSFDKGCYLGQEVVCMLENRGHVKRKLAPLVLESADVPERGAAVTDAAGAAIGEVTSSAFSPKAGRPIALAMLKQAQTAPGNVVLVRGAKARVVDRPA